MSRETRTFIFYSMVSIADGLPFHGMVAIDIGIRVRTDYREIRMKVENPRKEIVSFSSRQNYLRHGEHSARIR